MSWPIFHTQFQITPTACTSALILDQLQFDTKIETVTKGIQHETAEVHYIVYSNGRQVESAM